MGVFPGHIGTQLLLLCDFPLRLFQLFGGTRQGTPRHPGYTDLLLQLGPKHQLLLLELRDLVHYAPLHGAHFLLHGEDLRLRLLLLRLTTPYPPPPTLEP